MDAAGNCYYSMLTDAALNCYRRQAGGITFLGDVPASVIAALNTGQAAALTVKLVATGPVLQVYVQGEQVLYITDGLLVAGKPGLFAGTGGGPIPFEDFECSDALVTTGGGGGGGGGLVPRGGLLGVG
jgi:hypothetical protein